MACQFAVKSAVGGLTPHIPQPQKKIEIGIGLAGWRPRLAHFVFVADDMHIHAFQPRAVGIFEMIFIHQPLHKSNRPNFTDQRRVETDLIEPVDDLRSACPACPDAGLAD